MNLSWDCEGASLSVMHLGQAAKFLAEVLNRPASAVRTLSRVLREGGWIEKGARGRNAPHLSAQEMARFLIALMCAPDSPALAAERLPHFLALPHEGGRAFDEVVAVLLERVAREDWRDARTKGWVVEISVDTSTGIIQENHPNAHEEPIRHGFSVVGGAADDAPLRDAMPYFGGLMITVAADWLTLVRVAKVALAGEPDPLVEICAAILSEPEGVSPAATQITAKG